ncbi:MAG: hypothetical protein ACK4NC_03465 [Candidatus Gracilibacteria bacterium]
MEALVAKAAKNLSDILKYSLKIEEGENVLVIYDRDSELSSIIADGYIKALPDAQFIEFGTTLPEDVIKTIFSLKAKDSVILVQTGSFRLNEFRLRIEIFKQDMKTIEHVHLGRIAPEQFETYINALSYDPEYYHGHGQFLKKTMDTSTRTEVHCRGGTVLMYDSPMEPSKLNIGDYTSMKNVGGTFPIGEVFTEPSDLSKVNGEAMICAFAGIDHIVRTYKPFKVLIENGILSAGEDAPKDFYDILDLIRVDEEVLVREFGLGLNAAMGPSRLVNDITAFERMRGLHVSLGAKHSIYSKPGLHKKKTRYHIDVFFDVASIVVDGKEIFNGQEYIVG